MTTPARRGTILIIVAGLSALLASLALAFLVHMRSDVEEATELVNEVQAHLMLLAGCNFIQEGSRLGYDTNPPPINAGTSTSSFLHDEGYGWVDVRDGSVGPKDQLGQPVQSKMYLPPPLVSPVPTTTSCMTWMDITNITDPTVRPAFRAPMYVENRPPFAIQQTVARNPISTLAGDPNYGMPLMLKPDPYPVADPTTATFRSDYISGDIGPNAQFYVGSWFRVFRESPSTFIVTCGSGETRGWSSWTELTGGISTAGKIRTGMVSGAQSAIEQAYFNNDSTLFANLQNTEIKLWYRVEWSAAIHSADYQNVSNNYNQMDEYVWRGLNSNQEGTGMGGRSQPHDTNMVGTIKWVQRLIAPPTNW